MGMEICCLWKERGKWGLSSKIGGGCAIPRKVWPSQKDLFGPGGKSWTAQELACLSLPHPHPHPVLSPWVGAALGSVTSAQRHWWIQRDGIWEPQLFPLQQLTCKHILMSITLCQYKHYDNQSVWNAFVHTFIEQIFIELLLCVTHPVQYYRCHREQNVLVSILYSILIPLKILPENWGSSRLKTSCPLLMVKKITLMRS